MTSTNHYPGFDHPAAQISKFLAATDFFTIMLENGDIIHFIPKDEVAFRKWLQENNIPDIRAEDGWIIPE